MRAASRLAESAIAVVVLACALGGCGEPESQVQAEVASCESIAALQQSIGGLQEIDAESTGEDAKAAVEAVRDAWDQVRLQAQSVRAADSAALENAVDAVADSVAQIDDADTLGAAGQVLRTATQPLQSVASEITDGFGCP
jgi:hypothetical protein